MDKKEITTSSKSVNSSNKRVRYNELSKKEKEDLEKEHKNMFSRFSTTYDEKVQDLLYDIMPKKIKEIDDVFKKFKKEKMTAEEITKDLPFVKEFGEEDKKGGTNKDFETEENFKRKGEKPGIEGKSEESGDLKKLKTNREKPGKGEKLGKDEILSLNFRRLERKVGCNKKIEKVIKRLKEECIFFIKMVSTLKLWIQLRIPKIEDGNNFGVTVQEEVVTELADKQNCAFSIMEAMRKYFEERFRIIRKILKNENIEDMRKALIEFDVRAMMLFRMDFLEMRNFYLILLDVIKKNMDKLKKPRGNGSSYNSMF